MLLAAGAISGATARVSRSRMRLANSSGVVASTVPRAEVPARSDVWYMTFRQAVAIAEQRETQQVVFVLECGAERPVRSVCSRHKLQPVSPHSAEIGHLTAGWAKGAPVLTSLMPERRWDHVGYAIFVPVPLRPWVGDDTAVDLAESKLVGEIAHLVQYLIWRRTRFISA